MIALDGSCWVGRRTKSLMASDIITGFQPSGGSLSRREFGSASEDFYVTDQKRLFPALGRAWRDEGCIKQDESRR